MARRPRNAPELTLNQAAFIQAGEQAEIARLAREREQLERIAAAQQARAASQRRAARRLAIVALLLLAMLVNVLWQQHDTTVRESRVFTSLAGIALREEQFDRALRYAVQGVPPRGAIDRTAMSAELEAKLAGGGLSSRLRLVLKGHSGPVAAASTSPDGSRIVTASDDGTARVWDAATGTESVILRGHTDWVRSAAFSPDGARIVTASHDRTARL